MRQDIAEPAGNMITMEEYLKKRQAIKKNNAPKKDRTGEAASSALEIAELLFV